MGCAGSPGQGSCQLRRLPSTAATAPRSQDGSCSAAEMKADGEVLPQLLEAAFTP